MERRIYVLYNTLSKLCKIKGTTIFSKLCFKIMSMVEKYIVCPQNQVTR